MSLPYFQNFDSWVNKASSWLQPGDICIDAKGRRCRVTADFHRARDEEAFPVQIVRGPEAKIRYFDAVPVKKGKEHDAAARPTSEVAAACYGALAAQIDHLRDEMDPLWYAMSDEGRAALNSEREHVPSTLEDALARMRAAGWTVAVHNDYRQDGKTMTFWLFTHANGRWVKGEAETDAAAIAEASAFAGKI